MADEDPDDPQLKALRAVWLAMRDSDEDPPDSGVSALMAAARSQASVMTVKPAWWKRAFDQLRRPPVLALATLMILIGGAVLMTKHDTIEKAPTTAPSPRKELPPRNLDIGGEAPAEVTPVEPRKADLKLESAGKPKDEAPADHRPPPPERPHPAAHSAGKGAPPSPTADPGFAAGAVDMPPAPAKRPSAKAESDVAPNHVLVDQLAAQARGAAKRGDCENAKAIATRIAGQDAAYYREHVAGDLAKCVATPAAPAAADAAQ